RSLMEDGVEQPTQPVAGTCRERFGGRLLYQSEDSAALHHFGVRPAFIVAPESNRRRRVCEPEVVYHEVWQPWGQCGADDEEVQRCDRLEPEDRMQEQRKGSR